MEKKAELSINIIVVTVIALVVLAVIVFLIMRSANNYSGTTACLEQGGVCKDPQASCDPVGIGSNLCGENSFKQCCKPLV